MIRITSFLFMLVLVVTMAFFAPEATLAANSTDNVVDAAPPATRDEAPPTKAEAEAVPTIVVVQPRHEFPPVLEGEYVTHTFRVANQGTADLEVIRVRTG